MSTKYKFRVQDLHYFVSFAVVNWIDLFIRNEYKNILLERWKYCQAKKGLEIYGWWIMSSHKEPSGRESQGMDVRANGGGGQKE